MMSKMAARCVREREREIGSKRSRTITVVGNNVATRTAVVAIGGWVLAYDVGQRLVDDGVGSD